MIFSQINVDTDIILAVDVACGMVINLFNFFRHYKSPPFHTVIRIHLISLSYHILVFCHLILVNLMLMLIADITLFCILYVEYCSFQKNVSSETI